VRQASKNKTSNLIIANVDGTGETNLAVLNDPAYFSINGPAWSPDGARIAVSETPNGDFMSFGLETVAVGSGTKTRLGSRNWGGPRQMSWLPDGSAIVFAAPADKMSVNPQIWQVSYPGAQARRVTNDLNFYIGSTITADGSALATVQVSLVANLSITGFGSAISFSSPRHVTSGVGRADGLGGITWAPGDKIIYGYYSGGVIRFASVEPDGSNLHDLALNAVEPLWPSACGDGRHFIFSARNQSQGISIWRADIDGGNSKQITTGSLDIVPACSPDGKFVAYSSSEAGSWEVYVSPFPGFGSKWQVSRGGGEEPRWRRDGKELFYLSADAKLMAVDVKTDANFESGSPVALFQTHPRQPLSAMDFFSYDVTADGQKFLVNTKMDTSNSAPLSVILNWSAEMEK